MKKQCTSSIYMIYEKAMHINNHHRNNITSNISNNAPVLKFLMDVLHS